MRKDTGPIAFTITSSFHMATFIVNIICYAGVGVVIMLNRRRINVRILHFIKFIVILLDQSAYIHFKRYHCTLYDVRSVIYHLDIMVDQTITLTLNFNFDVLKCQKH